MDFRILSLVYFKGLYIQDIEHQRVCLHTHKQNEIAEKKNHHSLQKVHTLLQCSQPFWCESCSYCGSSHQWSSISNNWKYITIWMHFWSFPWLFFPSVFTFYKFLTSSEMNRILLQSTKCIFLGYSDEQKGLLCYADFFRHAWFSTCSSLKNL